MKQINLMLATIAVGMAGGLGAQAEMQQDYTFGFNDVISTSSHDFRVASNWKHIVDKYSDSYGDYYMSYSYKPTDGINGSGTLLAYEQKADGGTVYDLIVTPEVQGTVKINLKKYNNSGKVEFYYLNESGTAREGSPIKTVSSGEMSTTEFREFSFEVEDLRRIGIRASYAYLDDFYAENANKEVEKSIRIVSAVPSETTGTLYWDQQPDGNVLVKYTVTVENNGEAPLVQGEKGYTISLVNGKTNAVLGAPTKVPQDLGLGATSEPFEVSVSVDPATVWPNSYTYIPINLRENLQGTVVQRAQSNYKKYVSEFNFYKEDGRTKAENIAFGVVNEAATQNFRITNSGVAPLRIVSIAVPEGFSVTPVIAAGGKELAGGATENVALTLSAIGKHTGDVTLTYREFGADADKTVSVPVSGTYVAQNVWFEDFNNTSEAIKWPEGSVAQSNVNGAYSSIGDIYDNNIKCQFNYEGSNIFFTPLLSGEAGDELSFDLARWDTESDAYELNVYVTDNRYELGEPVLTVPVSELTDDSFKPYSVALPQSGDYYIAFKMYGMKIDNLAGLQKKEVEHDIYISNTFITNNESVQTGTVLGASISFVPVKAMQGAEYSVKLYLDGKVAATAESVDLNASSKNSRTFSLPFTAESETTVTLPARFAVEFTDGTVFSTPDIQLTITNESAFAFDQEGVMDVTGKNALTSRKTPIDFGTVNEYDVARKFEIANWGTAPLTVKSIVVPDGFTSSVADCTVEPKSTVKFDITFSAKEPGAYEGDLMITYVDAAGADAVYTIPVKGVLLDPSKWYVTFDNGSNTAVLPAGSILQKNVQTTTPTLDNVVIYSTSGKTATDRMFITPKLVAQAGETLQFDSRLNGSWRTDGGVTLYAAKTREGLADEAARIILGDFCGDNEDEATKLTTDFKTCYVTVPEAGEYYIGFDLYNSAYVDEIYGLTLADVTHDILLVSSDIPTQAMQNVAKEATMKVCNIGLAAEEAGSYTVTAYIDGTPVSSEGTVEIPVVNRLTESTAIPVMFRSPKAGTFPVYLELTAGDFSIVTEPVDVTFEEEILLPEVTVGEPAGYNPDVWVKTGDKNSETIALYTQSDLGLSGGEKIEKIVLKGYSTAEHTGTLKVYYEWTDDTEQAKPSTSSNYDYSSMTEYFDGDYKWEIKGSKSEPVDYITLEFDKPLEYEAGKSLRIFVANHASTYKSGVNFEYSRKTANTWLHSNDGTYGVLTGVWSAKSLPVLHLTLKIENRTLSGTVDNVNGDLMAGAEVTLVSNDGDNVQYAATTDANGAYTLNVIQTGRTYDVNVKADGFQEFEDGLSFETESLERDYTLRPVITVSDDAIHEAGADNAVVYLEKSLAAGFNAVTLPVSLDSEEVAEIFGDDAIVMQFVSDEGNASAVKANFAQVTSIVAGQPYLLWLAEPSEPAMFRAKDVVETLIDNPGTSVTFKPTDRRMQLADGMFVLTDDNFEPAAKTANMLREVQMIPAYGAYVKANSDAVKSLTFTTDADIPSGIEDAEYEEQGEDRIYNLDGIRVKNPDKGIYIINGKAILVK